MRTPMGERFLARLRSFDAECPECGMVYVVRPEEEWVDAFDSRTALFRCGERGGPRNLDSGLSEISIVFQAAVPKPVVPKYTTSGVRRPSER